MSVAWTIEAQLGGDYATRIAALTPAGEWRLADAVASVTAADASGNAHPGSVVGGVTFGQTARQPDGSTAALFNGTTGYVSVPHAAGITPSGDFTIGLFLTTAPSSNDVPLVQKFGGGAHPFDGFLLSVNGDAASPGKLTLWTGMAWVRSATRVDDGQRHHVAAVLRGSNVEFYIDGRLDATTTPAGGTRLGDTHALEIARRYDAATYAAATIDSAVLYLSALTPAQILLNSLSGRWTDLTPDRAHPQGAPITLYGGIDGIGKPGDVMATPALWSFALDNAATNSRATAGAYSPNNASCLVGWTDGIRCRISVTIGAHPAFYKFCGWIEDIIPEAGLFADRVVRVIVSDWLGAAASALAIGVAAQAGKTGDQLTDSLAQLVAPAPYATRYDAGTTSYAYGLDDLDRESKVLAGLQNVAASGLDRIYLAGDTVTGGVLRFEDHTVRRTFTTDAFTLSDAAPGGQPGLALTDLQVARRRADRLNRIRFTMKPRKVDGSNVVLYTENIDTSTAVAVPAAGGSVTLWCDYADPNQLAQQVAIVPASGVVPVATTDYLLNSAANGSGTNLTASCTVVATFFGNTAKVVITNNHATLPAFRTLLQLRGKGIYAYQAVTLEAIDDMSVRLSGERPATGDMPYQSSQQLAQAAAEYYRDLLGSDAWTPIDALSVFVPVSDEATLWTLVNAETSTAFSVSETVSGLSMYPLWVNKWQLEIDERDHVTFTFVPEPRDPNQYWSLGVAGLSELGVTTFFAPF